MSERKNADETPDEAVLPNRSQLLVDFFSWYTHHYVKRHFRAVRVDTRTPLPTDAGPLIVYLNHSSWWDPLTCLLAARHCFPDKKHYAPIDAEQLERYRFFSRLGFFGVEPGSRRGAVALLRVGGAILQQPDAALWITPQGRFADPRERPLVLKPGLARLARRAEHCTLLPLAIEYVFGEEPLPEVLLRFGKPMKHFGAASTEYEDFEELLRRRLQETQDALAERVIARDYSAFKTILHKKSGINFIYDLWRRMRALLRGEPFRLGHGEDTS